MTVTPERQKLVDFCSPMLSNINVLVASGPASPPMLALVVDTSGSMAARRRSQTVTTVALSLLADSYRRRDRVTVVTFRGRAATVVVVPAGTVCT